MKQILNIAYYEVVHVFKDRILFLLVFFVPLIYASLLGLIYASSILQQVPLGIVDLDHSAESRAVISAFENSNDFQVITSVDTYAELEQGMKNGTVRAGVVIPEDYSQRLAQHRLTQILTVYDGSNLIYGYNTRRFFQQVLNTFSTDHTAAYLAGLGMSKQEIKSVMDSVSVTMQVWYNPTYSYSTFIFPGLIIIILHQIGLLGIGLTVTREKERNTWLQYLCTAVPQWKIFMGKALPYFIVNFFNYGLLLWLAARFINVKLEGSLALILLLGLIFNMIITSLGFIISLYAPNSLQVSRYLMLLSVPLFFISGYTWPGTHMPALLYALGRLMPFTWMTEGLRWVTLKNLGLNYLAITIIVMSSMAAITLFFALTFTKRRNPAVEGGVVVNSGSTYPRKNSLD